MRMNTPRRTLSLIAPLFDHPLAWLFSLVWAQKLKPAAGDTEEVLFIKENTRPKWAYYLVLTVREETYHPFRNIARLLVPYPDQWPLQTLHSSFDFFDNPSLADELHFDDWRLQQYHPYRSRDTPLRSLYRMHAWACAGEHANLGYEAQYFYSHPEPEWRFENVPDPMDPDPVRYAILAGLVEIMTITFNDRFEMGIGRLGEGLAYMFYGKLLGEGRKVQVQEERTPEWARKVPPVPGPRVVLRLDGKTTCARAWYDRNILLGGAGYLEWC